MPPKVVARVIGVAAALAGAAAGYWCVGILTRQGIHAIVLPAALPGLTAGILSKERSVWWAVLYGAIGVAAALFTEWKIRPFFADSSAGYFVQHLGDLLPVVKVVIGIGAAVGAILSLSFGRVRTPSPKHPSA